MTTQVGHFINGQQVAPQDGNLIDIHNPSTGAVCGQVEMASSARVQHAIDTAQAAFPAWRATPPAKRAQVMFRLKQLLEQHSDKICALISEEHGKVLHDAKGELQRGIENVEFACGMPQLLKGEHSKDVGPGIDAWCEFQPLGVVAGITPFNFPAMVPLWMWPSAIMCGNTFVLKPSEKDPSSALFIAELAAEAGLPPGVLNVVNGDKAAVDHLLENSTIQAVSFVGSTPVAEAIYKKASENGKRCQALGGAKNHAIVMPDADLDNVVNALMGAAYGSCGERCMAISVVLAVGDEVGDALRVRLTQQVETLKVGAGCDNSNDMGPLISEAHYQTVANFIESGVSQEADLVCDGRGLSVEGYENGYFLGATLFDHVKPHMDIYQKEIFGPVLVMLRVPDMQSAVNLINEHEYGNGTCLFTRDGEAARYFIDQVQVGMVGVNVPLPVPASYHSFGGWKRSLFGDLHAYGPDSVRFYTRRKAVTQRWPSANLREGSQFSFPSHS